MRGDVELALDRRSAADQLAESRHQLLRERPGAVARVEEAAQLDPARGGVRLRDGDERRYDAVARSARVGRDGPADRELVLAGAVDRDLGGGVGGRGKGEVRRRRVEGLR